MRRSRSRLKSGGATPEPSSASNGGVSGTWSGRVRRERSALASTDAASYRQGSRNKSNSNGYGSLGRSRPPRTASASPAPSSMYSRWVTFSLIFFSSFLRQICIFAFLRIKAQLLIISHNRACSKFQNIWFSFEFLPAAEGRQVMKGIPVVVVGVVVGGGGTFLL